MPKSHQIIHHILFTIICAFTIYTGIMGIDFGRHWDERKLMTSVRESVPYGSLIPGWYNYPSVIYNLVVLSSSPEIIVEYVGNRSEFTNTMEIWLADKALVIRSRIVFLCIVTLSLLWVYMLIFKWTKNWTPALLGALALASSWEFSYHARWLAPDGILMQFGVLAVLLVFLALGASGKRRYVWLTLATVTAGMACGTKYYGGIFLLPIIIGGYKILKDAKAGWTDYVLASSSLAGVFALAFLLTTPGAVIDTGRFIEDIQFEIDHYKDGHPGYSVTPGWTHFSLMSSYIFGVFFSTYPGISIGFSILAGMGLYKLFKENWREYETWTFIIVPLFYIPYMSMQRVMMVRNYLILFPFLSVLFAQGIMVIWESSLFQKGRNKFIIVTLLGFISFLNFSWIYLSARSIPNREGIKLQQALQEYLYKDQEITYYLSEPTKRLLTDENISDLQNIVGKPSLAQKYVYLSDEVENPRANRPGIYKAIFGPYEVNYDYYPSWDGDQRIIIMPMEDALQQSQFGINNP